MTSGSAWISNWRSCSSSGTVLSIAPWCQPLCGSSCSPSGGCARPTPDDVQHYQKLLAGLARVEVIEVREDEQVPKRVPDRAFTVLLAADGKTFDSEGFSALPRAAPPGRAWICAS